jgi:hypothetical protein
MRRFDIRSVDLYRCVDTADADGVVCASATAARIDARIDSRCVFVSFFFFFLSFFVYSESVRLCSSSRRQSNIVARFRLVNFCFVLSFQKQYRFLIYDFFSYYEFCIVRLAPQQMSSSSSTTTTTSSAKSLSAVNTAFVKVTTRGERSVFVALFALLFVLNRIHSIVDRFDSFMNSFKP